MTKKEFIQRATSNMIGSEYYRGYIDGIIKDAEKMADQLIERGYLFDDDDFETKESLKTFIGQISDHLGKLVNDDEGNSIISAIQNLRPELKKVNGHFANI